MLETTNEVQTAVNAGKLTAGIEPRKFEITTDAGPVPVVLVDGDDSQSLVVVEDVLKVQDKYANAPRRITGTAVHQEMDSFIFHTNRFKGSDSVIWADLSKSTLTAVFDYHGGNQSVKADDSSVAAVPSGPRPRWAGHRAAYTCPLSTQWKRWIGANEKWTSQAEFAAFVEDNLHDLTSAPKEWDDAGEYTQPAAVVQAVRTLAVHTGIKFKSVINRDTGATEMLFDLEHDQKDVAKIPRGFVLAIPIYLNGAVYAVRARIRFRKTDEKAMFQYAIVGPEVLLRDAFNDVRTQAVAGTGLPMFCGSPE